MRYNEEIEKTEQQLIKLRLDKVKFQKDLEGLEVGGIVYLMSGHGGFDEEYFPQEIMEIDIPNCQIKVFERSINEVRWISSFHLMNEKKGFNYYH